MIRCPCCEGRGEVEPGAPTRLTPMQLKIYLAVRAARHGLSVQRLANRVYEDRINGGPELAFDTIRTQVHLLNKRIAPFGERIRSEAGAYRMFRV